MTYENITKARFISRPNINTHPQFGIAFDEARKAGVEIRFLKCYVEPDSLKIVN